MVVRQRLSCHKIRLARWTAHALPKDQPRVGAVDGETLYPWEPTTPGCNIESELPGRGAPTVLQPSTDRSLMLHAAALQDGSKLPHLRVHGGHHEDRRPGATCAGPKTARSSTISAEGGTGRHLWYSIHCTSSPPTSLIMVCITAS